MLSRFAQFFLPIVCTTFYRSVVFLDLPEALPESAVRSLEPKFIHGRADGCENQAPVCPRVLQIERRSSPHIDSMHHVEHSPPKARRGGRQRTIATAEFQYAPSCSGSENLPRVQDPPREAHLPSERRLFEVLFFFKFHVHVSLKFTRFSPFLFSYGDAILLELKVRESLERKDWAAVVELTNSVGLDEFQQQREQDRDLPLFLRRFTAGAVRLHMLDKRVEALQTLKRHQEAVHLLRQMIQQDCYLLTHRGYWFERLALNLEQHLKDPHKVFFSSLLFMNQNGNVLMIDFFFDIRHWK